IRERPMSAHAGVGEQCLRPVRRSRTTRWPRPARSPEPRDTGSLSALPPADAMATRCVRPVRRSRTARSPRAAALPAIMHRIPAAIHTVALRATGRKHCAPTLGFPRTPFRGDIALLLVCAATLEVVYYAGFAGPLGIRHLQRIVA